MKSAETPIVKMWIEDGILFGIYKENAEVELADAELAVKTRFELCEHKSYPCLIDIRGLKHMSKEARAYMADEGAKYIIAAAVITGNPFTRTFAHIFLTINKPPVSTRLFGDVASAKEWLMQFVRLQNEQRKEVKDKDTQFVL